MFKEFMILHITKKTIRFIVIGWLILFSYFFMKDFEALSIYVVLSIILGFYIYVSVKFNHYVLSLFMLFSFITHAISPPFFFINKDKYNYAGWSAVKDFNFEIETFSEMYFYLMLLLFFVLLFSILFKLIFSTHGANKALINRLRCRTYFGNASNAIDVTLPNRSILYSVMLMLFIFVCVIPMNIFMFDNGISIMGIQQIRLPYKLTGILFYLRGYVMPAVMFYLYVKSKKNVLLDLTVLLCAVIAGICAQSKGVVLMTGFPVLMFNLQRRNWFRLVAAGSLIVLLVSSMGYYRGIVISLGESPGFVEFLKTTPEVLNLLVGDSSERNPFSFVIKLFFNFVDLMSSRLGGVQDIVLGYQCALDNTFRSTFNFFTGQPVFEAGNMVQALYGFDLPEDAWVGIGMTLLGYLIMFSRNSIFLLIICSLLVSILITISESILKRYFSQYGLLRSVGYFLGVYFALQLYSGAMGQYYVIALASIVSYKLIPYILPRRFRESSLSLGKY